jgi:hypothetical protein
MFVTEVSTCAASRGSDFFQRQGAIIYIHFSLSESENIKNMINPDITGINER